MAETMCLPKFDSRGAPFIKRSIEYSLQGWSSAYRQAHKKPAITASLNSQMLKRCSFIANSRSWELISKYFLTSSDSNFMVWAMNQSCSMCLMPFKKDKGQRESENYCSYCFKNGELVYKETNVQEFKKICREQMIKNGTPKFIAHLYTFMISFAPHWKQTKKKSWKLSVSYLTKWKSLVLQRR